MRTEVEKLYTVEEYFELEKNSEVKHEYVNGVLIEMAGESKKANKLNRRITRLLEDQLDAGVFDIFTHEVKLAVNLEKIYRYPDIVVAPTVDDEDDYFVTQPLLVVEVLSPGTEAVDRGEKLNEYLTLPTLRAYWLVSQEKRLIETYSRGARRWEYEFFDQPDARIELPDLQVAIRLEDVYARFGNEEPGN